MDGIRRLVGFGDVQLTFGGVTRSSFLSPFFLAGVGVFIIILAIYFIIRYRRQPGKYLLTGPVDLFNTKEPVIVERAAVREYMRGSYTLSFYCMIATVPDMRSIAPLMEWPGVWKAGYNPAKEELLWSFTDTPDVISITPVSMQRWNQITVTQEGRTLDFYVNGELVKSHTLDRLPTPNTNAGILIKTENLLGQLGYVEVLPKRITVSEVKENYIETSDSQGRPYNMQSIRSLFEGLKPPNLFCPSGNCTAATPTADKTQAWEFPYA